MSRFDRLGKGILDRFALGRIRARRSKRLIPLNHHHLRPHALERHDPSLAALAAIEADLVGSQAGGEAGGVEEVAVESWNLEKQRAGVLVPVEREVAVELLHARGSFFDARRTASRCRLAAAAAAPLSADG